MDYDYDYDYMTENEYLDVLMIERIDDSDYVPYYPDEEIDNEVVINPFLNKIE